MDPYAHPPTPSEVGVFLSELGIAGPDLSVALHTHQGDVNHTFFAGEFVVRIAKDEAAEEDWRTEGVAHPYASGLGVPTPLLLFHGRDALGRAATIVRRIHGRDLTEIDAPEDDVWRRLGTALATLHGASGPADPDGALDVQEIETFDPPSFPITLRSLADELAPYADGSGGTYIHGDVTRANLLRRADGALFLIDWGDAGYGHAAYDFESVPPLALSTVWRAYATAGGCVDDDFRRRVVALHLRFAFHPSYRNERHRHWLLESAEFLRRLAFGEFATF